MPLSDWLRQHFRQHKKFGSRDRKTVADLCYGYYRLGGAFAALSVPERLLTAAFLVHNEPQTVLQELRPEWNANVHCTLAEKLVLLNATDAVDDLFPLKEALSPEIDQKAFAASFLVQPDLFLRVRPGKKENVVNKLRAAGISFSEEGNTLALANSSKIQDLLEPDREAVVQDASSQKVLEPLRDHLSADMPFEAWDCCAASGGKSILLHDTYPNAHLTVSDIRESILANLHKRFTQAGIRHYDQFLADLSVPGFRLQKKFDLVLCDAPCSGSGTWGRTPEQLAFFTADKINYYAALQKKIADNALRYIKQNGYFLYITCSVFKGENESVAEHIARQGLQLRSMQYFKGYTRKADTMFAALFTV